MKVLIRPGKRERQLIHVYQFGGSWHTRKVVQMNLSHPKPAKAAPMRSTKSGALNLCQGMPHPSHMVPQKSPEFRTWQSQKPKQFKRFGTN